MSKTTKAETPIAVRPPAAPPVKKSRFTLEGLDGLAMTDLATGSGSLAKPANETSAEPNGVPLMLALSEVREDPNQPRKTFEPEALRELADSIKEHGVKSPISVKSKNAEGFYEINYGARRYRASLIAKLTTIPAFVDDQHDDYAQVVENVQRDNLKPMELARFIGAKLDGGAKEKDIAVRLGKGKAFVSKHAAIVGAPDYLTQAADGGLLRSYDGIYELTIHVEKNPKDADSVKAFVDRGEPISQFEVRQFVKSLKGGAGNEGSKVSSTQLSESSGGTESTGGKVTEPGPGATKPAGEGTEKVSSTKLSDPANPNEPARTSTPEEQDAAAAQHATDAFFRNAHASDQERGCTLATQVAKTAERTAERKPAVHSGFDTGRGEGAEPEPKTIETSPVKNPVLMFQKGSKGGTVNLGVTTDYGFLMVRYEGEEQDRQERASEIQVTALIASEAKMLHVEH